MSEEKKVTILDPAVGAYHEVPLSKAKEYVENLESIKEAIANAEEGEEE